MPTVLRVDGVDTIVFPNEHPPPHVHAVGGGGQAQSALNCPTGPADLMDQDGFSPASVSRLRARISESLDVLCPKWRSMHG